MSGNKIIWLFSYFSDQLKIIPCNTFFTFPAAEK